MGFGGDFLLDEAVIRALPVGTRVVAADSLGNSSWNITARINTVGPEGTEKRFSLKCATNGDGARTMMEGEFRAMVELYEFVPSVIPEPHTWGKFDSTTPVTHFLVIDFKDMNSKLPDPKLFCSEVARLHQNSVSITVKFGFDITTPHGKFPQYMTWDNSWESMFRKLLSDVMVLDVQTDGPWTEFQDVYERALALVLPKLIGPLEADGRTIKSCLFDGDLWKDNQGTDDETGTIYIFDASSFYGHNELEFGMWRGKLNRMSPEVYNLYHTHRCKCFQPRLSS